MLLESRALAALKQWDQALDMIGTDDAPDSRRLRADIYWESGNWAVAAQKAEELSASAQRCHSPADDGRPPAGAARRDRLFAGQDEPGVDRIRSTLWRR